MVPAVKGLTGTVTEQVQQTLNANSTSRIYEYIKRRTALFVICICETNKGIILSIEIWDISDIFI